MMIRKDDLKKQLLIKKHDYKNMISKRIETRL